jgi:tetratricopeptide (TPR) repeat protein
MRERVIRDAIERMLADAELPGSIPPILEGAPRAYSAVSDWAGVGGLPPTLIDIPPDDLHSLPAPAAARRAIEESTSAIAAGRADARTLMRRGAALERLGDAAGAERDYSRAIDQGATMSADALAAAYHSRCVCRRRLGDAAGAVADGERAVALAAGRACHHAALGRARLHGGNPLGALADLGRALAIDPCDPRAREDRGRCYQALGDHQRAIADFGHLLACGGASYRTLLLRAQSHLALGGLGAALIDCEIAERQARGAEGRVYLLRGRVLSRIGDRYGALRDLSFAIGLGERGVSRLWRGLVYLALGNVACAREDLIAFVLDHPGGAEAALGAISRELARDAPDRPAMPAAYPAQRVPMGRLAAVRAV